MVPDAKHVGVRIEAHTVKVSLDPKVGVELSERSGKTGQVGIVGRWADVDVDRGVPRVMQTIQQAALAIDSRD